MFELDEDTEDSLTTQAITMIDEVMDENNIEDDDRNDLRILMIDLLSNTNQTKFECSVKTFIALYVVREIENWRSFVTVANLDQFVCDSVLIMSHEAEFLTDQPWVTSNGKPYDLMTNFLCFMGEQFITIFES